MYKWLALSELIEEVSYNLTYNNEMLFYLLF